MSEQTKDKGYASFPIDPKDERIKALEADLKWYAEVHEPRTIKLVMDKYTKQIKELRQELRLAGEALKYGDFEDIKKFLSRPLIVEVMK